MVHCICDQKSQIVLNLLLQVKKIEAAYAIAAEKLAAKQFTPLASLL